MKPWSLALWLPLAIALLNGAVTSRGWRQETSALPRGHVFFETGFESADALQGWTRTAKLEAGLQSTRSFCFERGADPAKTTTLGEVALPVEKVRGYDVYLTACGASTLRARIASLRRSRANGSSPWEGRPHRVPDSHNPISPQPLNNQPA